MTESDDVARDVENPLRQIDNLMDIDPIPAKKQKIAVKKSPSAAKQAAKEVESDSDSEEEEEELESGTVFKRRNNIRRKIFKLEESVQKSQLQLGYGKVDADRIDKLCTHYKKSDITRHENASIVTGHEVACDAVVGGELSKLLTLTAGMINKDASKFDPKLFASKLHRFGVTQFYDSNCRDVFYHPPGFPSLCLLDTSACPKVKKTREPTVRGSKNKGELVNVQGKQSDKMDKEEDKSLMEQLGIVKRCFRKVLKNRKTNSINYYEFVIDPADFGASIQNCFYVAFLLKDSDLFLEKKEDDDYPILRKLTDKETEHKKKSELAGKPMPTHQSINTWTYRKWSALIEQLKLKEAIIKQQT